MHTRTKRLSAIASCLAFLALIATGPDGHAQPGPVPAPPPRPAPPAPPAPPQPAPPPPAPAVEGRSDPLAAALAPKSGGLTAEDVGKTASKTRHSVRAKQAELDAAAARVDQALVGYFPRLTVGASYTRLSNVNNSLGGAIVGTLSPGPVVADCTTGPMCVVKDSQGVPAQAQTLAFPSLSNSYAITASLIVPVSDYVLRTSQGYSAASHGEKGKKLELQAEQLQVSVDAKVAFFNFVRAKGQVVVAKDAVEQSKAHTADAKKAFDVGLTSRADVLRLESQVASSEQLQAQAEAQEDVATEQLRIVLGVPADQQLEIGQDVMHDAGAAPSESLQSYQDQAFQKRLEIRALDETIYSLKEQESLARAAALPRVDAFADLQYANPNQRIFPAQDKFDLTWDLGVRVSYTFNDTFSALGATAEAKARTTQVAEQKASLRDGLRLEVANAYADAKSAAVSIEAAERALAASQESLRVRRELFRNGKATSVDLIDAETEVTRSELSRLNARVGLLAAKTRLDHAAGRDVPQATAE